MHTVVRIAAAALVASPLTVAPAEAGRPCRRLCRKLIAENVVEHCSQYSGVLKRLCRKDVRTTLLGYCRRQPSGDCLGL
jgi:hypothetical protein